MLVLFLRFPRVSEVYLEKLTVLNSVPPFSSLKPNKKAIPAYPERVLKGFSSLFSANLQRMGTERTSAEGSHQL